MKCEACKRDLSGEDFGMSPLACGQHPEKHFCSEACQRRHICMAGVEAAIQRQERIKTLRARGR